MMKYWKIIFLSLAATSVLAGEPKITCEPRELRGVPGEPLQVELTVETDRAAPIHLRSPSISNLVLRTVEKIPSQSTPDGRYVQKRIIIWQGLEAGSITLTNLTAVSQGSEEKFPDIGITIDAVEPADPPQPSASAKATADESAPPPVEENEINSTHNPLLRRGAGTAGWVLRFPEAAI